MTSLVRRTHGLDSISSHFGIRRNLHGGFFRTFLNTACSQFNGVPLPGYKGNEAKTEQEGKGCGVSNATNLSPQTAAPKKVRARPMEKYSEL